MSIVGAAIGASRSVRRAIAHGSAEPEESSMIVMKFGGTSVGTATSIRRIAETVRARPSRKPVVVASALAGVTDALEAAARSALRGSVSLASIRRRHLQVIRELALSDDLVELELRELEELLRGVQLLG